MSNLKRPEPGEYNEYYQTYIGKVPEGDILEILDGQLEETLILVEVLSDEEATRRFGGDKWSVKEILAHLVDSERMFAYRALCFARNDRAALPSFEQERWVGESDARRRPLADLLEEFRAARRSHVLLFHGFPDKAWTRTGTASGYQFSVRAFPYIIAGHELHHRKLLQERYLPQLA